MAWYAYCIAERNAFPELCRHRRPMPLAGVTGLFGNQTFLFPASDLAVIVSEHTPEDAARMDQNAAKDHARVIADCFKLSTVLPFRFGTTFPDDDALRRSVRSNQRHFTANVERLRGKAEMHLKVLVDDTCPGNAARDMTVGQQYLTSLRESAVRQRERQSRARALSRADASHVPADCRGDHLQADGFGQDAAGHRPPDRQQDGGAVPEQVLVGDAGDEGVPDAVVRPVASVPLCAAPLGAVAIAQRL